LRRELNILIDLREKYECFERIEKDVNDYNKDLKNFEENGLENIIKDYFGKKGFNTIDNSEIPTIDNTIVIKELIPMLKRCWYEQPIPFVKEYEDGYLKIIYNTIIAKVTEDRKDDLKGCIEELKDYEEINRANLNLVEFFNIIKNNSEIISKEIGKNIVKEIEIGTYKTQCKFCKIRNNNF
jgi:hypothetical protein